MNSPQLKRVLAALLCLLCLAGGWAAGRALRTPVTAPPPPDSAPVAAAAGQSEPAGAEPAASVSRARQHAAELVALTARQDLRALRKFLREAKPDASELNFLADLWLKSDPEGFAAVLCSETNAQDPEWKYACRSRFFSRWAEKDFPAAHNFAVSLQNPESLSAAVSSIHPEWMKRDPVAAMNFVIAKGIAHVDTDFDSLPPAGPEAIAAVARLPSSWTKQNFMVWATKELPPIEAVRKCMELDQSPHALYAAAQIMKRATAEDVPAARQWLESETNPFLRTRAARSLATAMVETDPAAALEIAEKYVTGAQLIGFLRAAEKKLSEIDPEEAEKFRARLPAPYFDGKDPPHN